MATNEGKLTCHFDASGTAATAALTQKVNQVAIQNRHSTQTLSVTLATGETQAAAEAALVTAVALADETFFVAADQRKVIFKSPRRTYVAMSIIASGATTGTSVEGTLFFD